MFKKAAPPASTLSDRVRKVVENKPASTTFQATPTKRPERAPRQPLFRNGTLIVRNERVHVAITNLSRTGARVEFATPSEMPPEVVLVEPTLGLRRRARVAWTKQGAVGLKFIDDT